VDGGILPAGLQFDSVALGDGLLLEFGDEVTHQHNGIQMLQAIAERVRLDPAEIQQRLDEPLKPLAFAG